MLINFFGTDIFASVILQNLVDAGFDISCVVTKADDFVGRDKVLTESRVAVLAKNLGIVNVLKPLKLKGFRDELSRFDGDINVVCEYGKIIPDSVLNLPKYKSVNIHGSILPQYRGASPIQFSLMNGDLETGVTLMEMDKEMDHGNIIAISKYDIEITDTEPVLREKLANLGADLLIKELRILEGNGKFSDSIVQDHDSASYTRLLEKQDGFVDVSKDFASHLINKYRAFIKWPGVFMIYKDKRLKLNEVGFDVYDFSFEKNDNIYPFVIKDKELYLNCVDNKLVKIKKLQFEAKNEISDKDFINQAR